MDRAEILKRVDHTLLLQTATWEEIKEILDDAVQYKTASVCIPPCFVSRAAEYLEGKIKICTVIGFPNGYQTTKTKVFETRDAVQNGADEIDMVINLGTLKEKDFETIEKEICEIKTACEGRILKVIIETCLLSEEEKVKMCEIVTKCKANYIKTSTGFSSSGATREDIILFKKHIGPEVKIKAAGGIKTLTDAEDFINLGSDRLGTSRIIKIIKEEKK